MLILNFYLTFIIHYSLFIIHYSLFITLETLSQLHPIAVHIPIAILVVYILIEIFGLFKQRSEIEYMALFLLVIGLIGGIVSVITGNMEFQELQKNPSITQYHIYQIGRHSDMATLTMWYFIGILIIKFFILIKKKSGSLLHYFFVVLLLLGGYILYQTGKLGGILVYEYGIGTEHIF